MHLTQAIEEFTTYLAADGRSPGTIDCYRRDLSALAAFAGDPAVVDVIPNLLHRFVVSDAVQRRPDGEPRAEVTINRGKAALRSFGGWMVETGLADRNPAAGLSIRRTTRQSPSTLSDPERKRMLREVGARTGDAAARDRVMLELLLGTGIRLAELVGLDVGDVDLDGKRISIRAKGGRDETRFLSADLRRVLRRYLRQRAQSPAESPALFLSNRETRISARQVQARFRLWLQWAGIDREGLTVHSTRHTFGTRLYRRTHDLVLVGKAMGHRTVEATAIYVHQDDEALEEALDTL
ncbi:MAG: tyrosine-type recombinase/integrase [Pseudomonadota bacterium]